MVCTSLPGVISREIEFYKCMLTYFEISIIVKYKC